MITARVAWLLLVVGVLWACTSDYETFEPPPPDYSDREPLELAVERVAVDSAYRPAGAPPYVDHVMPVSPEAATRALLMQRLQAVGGTDRLQAVILEASVQEETLEPATGVRGYLTTEPAARLQGRIQVRVDRLDAAGMVIGSVSTAVERTRTVPEGVGYAERERIGYELVRDLVDDLDAGLSANIRESFADLVRPEQRRPSASFAD
ncbi:MAG: hypothetical protein ACREJ5_29075 [Geminicoccaceae bacterium]